MTQVISEETSFGGFGFWVRGEDTTSGKEGKEEENRTATRGGGLTNMEEGKKGI